MNDAQLRDAAVAKLKATTLGYTKIKKPIAAASNWGKALALLEKIGQADVSLGVCAYKTQDFASIAAMGVKHVRMDRPSAATIGAARAAGLEVLPIACYCPWEDLNGGQDDKHPPLPSDYGEWAARMVDLWVDMNPPPPAIEVWNEPWHSNFWKPAPDAAAYLELVWALASEAWAVWPNMTILVSADPLDTSDRNWREDLLAADTARHLADSCIRPTTHNYVEARTPTTVTGEPCKWDLDRFKCAYADFKDHGHPDPQVWITEFGWESDVVGEAMQAVYTWEAFGIFRASGQVEAAYAYFVQTGDASSYNWLRPDGSAKLVAGVAS